VPSIPDEELIHVIPPYESVRKRSARVPEGRLLFGRLSDLDNLLLRAYALNSTHETNESLESVMALFPLPPERQGQGVDLL
jgi:branched-chain amino acid transport system ATP-binding protein